MKAFLAYSGGLDTSAILIWLKKDQGFSEVICYCGDLGNAPQREVVVERAKRLGASEVIFENLQEEFCTDFVVPLLRSGALYEGEYLLGTAIARPIIAQKMSQLAKARGVNVLVHGATGKGNDQLRFEQAWGYLCPEIEILAPWKKWNFLGRSDLLKYVEKNGHPYDGEMKGKYSIDENIFHKSIEGGELECVDKAFDWREHFPLQVAPGHFDIKIGFEAGIPCKLDGISLSVLQILEILNGHGKKFQIGTVDIVEERANGIKSHGIYQTPGGTILGVAYKKLKEICWGHRMIRLGQQLAGEYADLVYEGAWFSASRHALDAFYEDACRQLNGSVELRVSAHCIRVLARCSPQSLYSQELVSFENDSRGINQASLGFSKTRRLIFENEGKVKIERQ